MIEIIKNNDVVGIVGGISSGKTNLLFSLLEKCLDLCTNKVYFYSYHSKYYNLLKKKVIPLHSIDELEAINNSIIFIDEPKYLLNLEDHKKKDKVGKILDFCLHNNNKLVFCGTESQFPKFLSSRIEKWFIKSLNIKALINGSTIKDIVINISGDFVGQNKLILDVGMTYCGKMFKVPYFPSYDTKKENKFTWKVRK